MYAPKHDYIDLPQKEIGCFGKGILNAAKAVWFLI